MGSNQAREVRSSTKERATLKLDLNRLPVDVLECVVAFCDSHCIGSLWFCGDSVLNRNLSLAVRHFTLEFVSWRKFVWPRLLHSLFDVRELMLSSSTPVASVPPLLSTWSVLLKGLEKLSLRRVTFPPINSSSGILSTTLHWLEMRECLAFDDYVALRIAFPNLETLIMQLVTANNSALLLPSNLPSSLTSFTTSHVIDVSPQQKRETDVGNIDEKEVALCSPWPPGLTHLELWRIQLGAGSSVATQSWMLELPQTLTALNTPIAKFRPVWWRSAPLSFLSQIKTLNVFFSRHLCPEDLLALPRGLTRLETQIDPTPELLAALPPCLTSMKIYHKAITRAELECLPPKLTEIEHVIVDKPETIAFLPARVLSLEFDSHGEPFPLRLRNMHSTIALSDTWRGNAPEGFENLPRSLKFFKARYVLPRERLLQLPSTVLTLDLTADEAPRNSDWWQWLPRNLTELRLTFFSANGMLLAPDAASRLPRALTTLKINGIAFPSRGTWMHDLPPELSTLMMQRLPRLRLASLAPLSTSRVRDLQIHADDIEEGSLWHHLPPTLTDLQLVQTGRKGRDLSSAELALCPKGLTRSTVPGEIHLTEYTPID